MVKGYFLFVAERIEMADVDCAEAIFEQKGVVARLAE